MISLHYNYINEERLIINYVNRPTVIKYNTMKYNTNIIIKVLFLEFFDAIGSSPKVGFTLQKNRSFK